MKNMLILLLIIILLISSCTKNDQKINNIENSNDFMKVQFKTSDNVNIVGNFYDTKANKNVILLHMFSKNKESWNNFPKELQKNGFNVLSIDLRGHGESDLDYNSFTDNDFNNMIKDVEAAVIFMKSKNIGEIYVIGASIGANLALIYAQKEDVYKIVLLSPGIDYKGIKTYSSLLVNDVLFVVSKDDAYSFDSVNTLYKDIQGKARKELKIYDNAGHGTNMFSQKDLSYYIIDWLIK